MYFVFTIFFLQKSLIIDTFLHRLPILTNFDLFLINFNLVLINFKEIFIIVYTGTRESAFVHAISSAGVAHALTRVL